MAKECSNTSCNKSSCEGCGEKKNQSLMAEPNVFSDVKHVIGVVSGKGGVGKSFVTGSLANMMEDTGYKVGIMDADITGPSIPRLMGLEHAQAFGTNDAIEPVVDKDGIKVMSLHFLMETENQPVVWRGPIVANAVKQFWTDVVWEELDYLFIDMPPGTGDVALTVLQSLPVSGVIMVSTPQPMVSMIVSKAINMCKQVKVEVLGIIENMSYVVCPDCGKRIEIFQHRNVEDFVRENEVPLWAELPMMDSISRIYKDDDFDTETAQQMYAWISPAADQLIEKMGK